MCLFNRQNKTKVGLKEIGRDVILRKVTKVRIRLR